MDMVWGNAGYEYTEETILLQGFMEIAVLRNFILIYYGKLKILTIIN